MRKGDNASLSLKAEAHPRKQGVTIVIRTCSGVIGETFGILHCRSSRSCNGVVLAKDQLSGFAFKLCAEISFFHYDTCVVLR